MITPGANTARRRRNWRVLRSGWNNKFQRSGSGGKSNAFPAIWKRIWLIETAGFKRAVPRARPELSQVYTWENRAGVAIFGTGFRPSAPSSGFGHSQAGGKIFFQIA